ncbi:dedicated sortase system histidine kinase [Luteibacter sp. Sphag1AF]|uniref:ATP-binding protein n=1 Tax=Luteibacter sp. Sphag1AF TaxID=2587031 RepID=UPI00160C6EA5|nr:ATP-binding protein [Luteibacter sp. Sphag1AF]MBB3227724.1 dedicated sortase system histidine kinase [Luteibacter sp. Sphag1AF]
MTLRQKLLLVALCTLALPVAGWLYVRQMETLLREGQAQALVASARALARSLVVVDAPLPPAGPAWYVQRTSLPITVDGYGDDWAALTPWAQPVGKNARLLLAEDAHWLYAYIDVRAPRRHRADAEDHLAMSADHLVLTIASSDDTQRYLIASSAPGATTGIAMDPPAGILPDRLNAQWQEDGSGFRVELRLPRGLAIERLGIGAHLPGDSSDPAAADVRPILEYSTALSRELALLAPDGVRVRVLAPDAWLLAQSGRLDLPNLPASERPGWFASLIYRSLLATRLDEDGGWAEDAPRVDLPEVAEALKGTPATAWRAGEARGSVVLAAAMPIEVRGQSRGVVLLEQPSRAVPLLANRALFGLLLTSFAVLLIAGGVLLMFATRLTIRLRRLRNAAERAQDNDGRLDGPFPLIDSEDELGDLARSFARLFDVVGSYTDYLRTLASKLSHELNTPLAIVKSSLDNLDHAGLPAEAQPYLLRARDGVARLGALVRAMSEASRMERAIAAAEAEDVNMADIVRGCAEGYRALAGDRRVECLLPQGPVLMHVSPELVAQALDKLFDNALSFTPPNGWLRISLRPTSDGADIELANQGPALPTAMQGRLFDSLVSLRDKATPGDAPHLGLGLYVVRLVAERHQGSASARNLEDGSGVAFTLHLRGLPRQRLG